MATRKRKSTASSKKYNSQVSSVITFCTGILIFMLTFIKGESAWLFIHNLLRGLFGISVFLVAPIILYASIMMAKEKSQKTVAGKMIEGAILIFLVSGIAQIFFMETVNGTDFLDKLINLYTDGVNLQGGGLFSAVLGWTLLAVFKETGAKVIILVLTFGFILLLTGLSIIDFFGLFFKPVKKAYNTVIDAKEEEAIENAKKALETKEEAISKKDKRKDFEIDIPLSNYQTEEDLPNISNPVIDVLSNKTKNQPKDEKPKTDDLDNLVKKAVEADKPKSEEVKPSEPIAEENGQTLLFPNTEKAKLYKYPPISLLHKAKINPANATTSSELKATADTLVDTLKSFGVQTRIVDIHKGPTVTRYELQPSAGVKISKITGLADDIALNLAAAGVRIEAPIPGKAAVGIEIPNKNVDIVTMREIVESREFEAHKSKISFALGRDITGNVILADIAKMPHMLIAGSTGSGKSVCINSIIMSLLYKSTPEEVRILMIDPKVVELGVYNGIPHLLIPVVTDPRKAAGALNWAVTEMLKRYKLFADNNVRDLTGYNNLAKISEELDLLPQIVIIIDELADLMMAAPSEVEDSICRLAQMARAAGMHLVIATQRPSVDIITGVIKANIPSRIAFAVSSQVDSRTILDGAGAEKLLGRGDMLYYPSGTPKPSRVQGCFVTDKEVESVVSYIKESIKADYDEKIIDEIEKSTIGQKNEPSTTSGGSIDSSDEMIDKAIEVVLEAGQASTSYLQRRLKLGYARAARIIDELEQMGIVGPFEGAKPRQIIMTKEQWYERKLREEITN